MREKNKYVTLFDLKRTIQVLSQFQVFQRIRSVERKQILFAESFQNHLRRQGQSSIFIVYL